MPLARLNCSDIDCQGERNSVSGLGLGSLGLGCGLGLWVSLSVSVLGLCLYVCLGSWSWVLCLCLSLSCFQLHCCQCCATPRPPSATWLNCLDLSPFAVFILRSAMSAGCLSVYLSSFLLFLPLLLFHLTLTPCAGGIHIWMPTCSVCLFVALSLLVVLLFTSVTPKAISNLAKLSNQLKYY